MAINERTFAESLAALVQIGVDAERERCAKIAERFQRSHKDFSVALDIAKAIRADVGTGSKT